MKILSWNVNGIRSILKKGFIDFVKKENPDVLCLQETRTPSSQPSAPFPPEADSPLAKRGRGEGEGVNLPQFQQYWNSSQVKSGYSGTAVFTKTKPIDVTYGMRNPIHDQEGRVITAEFERCYLVNVYVPNSKRDLSRLDYRQEWDEDFLKFLKKLEERKAVVFCGDLNVAHKEIDLTNPEANRRNHGFTDEERAGFDRIIKGGFLDTFRNFYNDGGHYTWWSQMNNCRTRNIGWRIDYFLISQSLRPHLIDAQILSEVMGSDHCPVSIELEI